VGRGGSIMELDKNVEGFLAIMLEGYETNLTNVTQFIDQNETQLNGAKAQRDEIVEKIAELKDLLGIDEETETPTPKLVEVE
jgi:hypothetical protein